MVENKTKSDKIIKKLSLVSIVGNVALSAFKLFSGIIGHSQAMVSDSIHSMSDVFSTFIALIGVHLAKKNADQEHPYGHERIECIASIILATLLAITGFAIGKTGVVNIISKSYKELAKPSLIALIAAIVSIVSKEAMFWYTRYYAKIINSAVFMADAWHHRSDSLSSIGSLIAIAGGMLGYPILDSIASIVICLFILKAALDIFKDACSKMLDTSSDANFENALKSFVEKQRSVIKVDLLHTRMFANRVYVDLELELDGNMSLRDSHAIAEEIHEKMEKEFPEIKHVMIHVNPGQASKA